MVFVNDSPIAAKLALQRRELFALERWYAATAGNALLIRQVRHDRCSSNVRLEFISLHAMTERFFTGDVDHWNIFTKSGAQAWIAVNVDLVQIDRKPRAANRPFGF